MYEVILSPEFTKEFYKLPLDIQKIARKKLNQLEESLIGEPLSYDLVGFYSIHFHRNKYRIIYYKEDNRIQVLIVNIGKRTDDFYKKLSDLVKKRKSQSMQWNSLPLSNLFK